MVSVDFDGLGVEIDRQLAGTDDRLAVTLRAADNGVDACDQFVAVEWLGDIVVGAESQCADLRVHLVQTGQDQYRGTDLGGAQFLEHVIAVHVGQVEVEQDELRQLSGVSTGVRALGKEVVERLGSVTRHDHLVKDTVLLERAQRLIDALKDKPGRKVIWILWAGASNPFKIADLDLKRYNIEISTGGNILPAMVPYKQFPGMEGAAYYYFGMPKNPVNEWLDANHYKQFKAPPDFFTAGGMSAAIALVEALKKAGGDTNTEKLIKTMEGMSFETPKGKMTFRKEDHQAMQSMYHFRIKADPAFAWGVPELVREIKPEEMAIPIRNKR